MSFCVHSPFEVLTLGLGQSHDGVLEPLKRLVTSARVGWLRATLLSDVFCAALPSFCWLDGFLTDPSHKATAKGFLYTASMARRSLSCYGVRSLFNGWLAQSKGYRRFADPKILTGRFKDTYYLSVHNQVMS